MNDLTMDLNTVSPHRYPFLLVDRIDAVDARKLARGTKLVMGSAWAIVGGRGHARLRAMPHRLIVAHLARWSGAVVAGLLDGSAGAIGYFVGLYTAHVQRAALPGDG